MGEEKKSSGFRLKFTQTNLLIALLIILIIVISCIQPSFLSGRNIRNVLLQNAITGIMTVGMAMLMISGGIDLSVGNLLSFIGCFLAFMINHGIPSGLAVLLAIGLATLLGLLSGLIIANTTAAPFIITLGLMSIYKALALIVSNGSDMPIKAFEWLGKTQILSITLPVWLFLLLFLVVGLILMFTKFGRDVYALGSNEQTAYISGIPVKKLKVLLYALNGFAVGLASAVMLSRLGSAVPTMGDGYEMTVIAACAIGGITLTGGEGSALGAFLGLLFLGIVRNGLNMMSVPSFYQYLVNGVIIVLAVLLSNYSNRKHA